MHAFPHIYKVSAQATTEGDVILESAGLPKIASQPPAEFGGPGDRWSPESLLAAAVADCFVLSFRAIAAASKVSFEELLVDVDGTLDMVDKQMKFTGVQIQAQLKIADEAITVKAERLLQMAEKSCLITNSLNCDVSLGFTVVVA